MNCTRRCTYSLWCSTFLALGIAWPSDSLAEGSWTLKSPTSRLEVLINHKEGFSYSVRLRGRPIILDSRIDLKVADQGWIGQQTQAIDASEKSVSESIDYVVPRKYRQQQTTYNELVISLADGAALVFRAYDEGVAYRWKTSFSHPIIIEEELSEFLFPENAHAWFPEEGNIFSHQERQYPYLPLKELDPKRFCSTGVLIDLQGGRKVFISESDLRSYPGMFLRGAGKGRVGLTGKYAPFPLETTAKNDRDIPVTKAAPYLSQTAGTRDFPWRVMLVTERDTELLESEIIFNLASPSEVTDTTWIKPGRVAWDWWSAIDLTGVDFRAGINTESYKYYIDFASDYGLEYLMLDEGWSASTTDILHPSPNVDLEELVEYGKQKNVRIILWVLWKSLDDCLEEALTKYEKMGIAGIKVDFMQRDDQWMVDFYERIARDAARHHLLVDFHGSFKPTGLRRTFPNVLTREGVTGMEHYKGDSSATNPEQELLLPFIRMVSGPMDFTPGALRNANRGCWRAIGNQPMSMGTRCHQLAMFVAYESPLQMFADSPSSYRREASCMDFLSQVPAVWDDTIALDAEVSNYLLLARRSGETWYVAAMTDWDSRSLKFAFDFLPPGEYQLDSWSDGVNADRNGEDFRFHHQQVQAGADFTIHLAPGGGWVGRLRKAGSAR